MDERPKEPAGGSWLDEVSMSTKIVVVVTVASVAGYMLLLVADLFF